MIRDTFQKMSGWTQLLFLFLFYLLGQSFTLFFVGDVLHIDISSSINKLSLVDLWKMQTIFALLTFLVPALFCASLFNKKPESSLRIDKGFSFSSLILGVIIIISAQPAVSLVSEWNRQISLPSSLHRLEEALQSMEKSAVETTDIMLLSNPSISALLINLLIVALLVSIAEEFFFRGIIQQIIQKISNNIHIAVWVTAVIFSFIHFQFYGFFPRILLGALLGYIFVWSRSLWLPILIHFINNAATIILYRQYHEQKNVIDFGTGETWWLALIGFLITVGALFYMKKTSHKTNIF